MFRVHGHTHDVNSRGPHSTAPVSQGTTRGSSWPTRSGCARLFLAATSAFSRVRSNPGGCQTIGGSSPGVDDKPSVMTRRPEQSTSNTARRGPGCPISCALAIYRPGRGRFGSLALRGLSAHPGRAQRHHPTSPLGERQADRSATLPGSSISDPTVKDDNPPTHNKGPPGVGAPCCVVVFGGVLLSHTLAGAVPSALEGLASGFGMGPGVSPPLWPPEHRTTPTTTGVWCGGAVCGREHAFVLLGVVWLPCCSVGSGGVSGKSSAY